jgi:hypothetical protein
MPAPPTVWHRLDFFRARLPNHHRPVPPGLRTVDQRAADAADSASLATDVAPLWRTLRVLWQQGR